MFSSVFSNFSSYDNIVEWNIKLDRDDYRQSEIVTLEYQFSIKKNWHIYSVNPEKSPK